MFKFLITLFLLISSLNTYAWTTIVYGKETDEVSWVRSRPSKLSAEQEALNFCYETNKNCELLISTTGPKKMVAVAKFDGGITVGSSNNLEEAEKIALDNCHSKNGKNCYIKNVYWDGIGFIAAKATVNNDNVELFFGKDSDEAMQGAIDACKRKTSTPDLCKATYLDNTAYFAYANNSDKNSGGVAISDSLERAEKLALEACKKGGKSCSIIVSFRSFHKEEPPKNVNDRIVALIKIEYEKTYAKK